MEYKLLFDSVEMVDIPNLGDITTSILYDSENRIYRDKIEVDIDFMGDCYLYLKNKMSNTCGVVLVTIMKECGAETSILFEGLIKNNGIKLFYDAKVAKCTIFDNNYMALINDKKSQKVSVLSNKTSDGTLITQITGYDVTFSNKNGVFYIDKPKGYNVWDIIKHLFNIYSNGLITCKSHYFEDVHLPINPSPFTGGKDRWFLFTGTSINRKNLTAWSFDNFKYIDISLKEIIDELFEKILDLKMVVEYDGEVPYIRIEKSNYFQQEEYSIELIDYTDLQIEIDKKTIYSLIKIGSEKTEIQDPIYNYIGKARLQTFDKEEYNNCSTCLTDNSLDLVTKWILDDNVIYETFETLATIPNEIPNAKDIFLIDCFKGGTNYFTTTRATGGLYGFNPSLTNEIRIKEIYNGLPECISKYYLGDLCVEYSQSDPTIKELLPCDDLITPNYLPVVPNKGHIIVNFYPFLFDTQINDCLMNIHTLSADFKVKIYDLALHPNGDNSYYDHTGCIADISYFQPNLDGVYTFNIKGSISIIDSYLYSAYNFEDMRLRCYVVPSTVDLQGGNEVYNQDDGVRLDNNGNIINENTNLFYPIIKQGKIDFDFTITRNMVANSILVFGFERGFTAFNISGQPTALDPINSHTDLNVVVKLKDYQIDNQFDSITLVPKNKIERYLITGKTNMCNEDANLIKQNKHKAILLNGSYTEIQKLTFNKDILTFELNSKEFINND